MTDEERMRMAEALMNPQALDDIMRRAEAERLVAPIPHKPMLDAPVGPRGPWAHIGGEQSQMPDDALLAGPTLRPNVPAYTPTINPQWQQPWNPEFQKQADFDDNAGAAAKLLSRYRWR